MSKMFLAVVASLAVIVTTSAAAKATFTVSVSPNLVPVGIPSNPPGSPGVFPGITYSASYNSGRATLSSNAVEDTINGSQLNTFLSISNTTSSAQSYTVTVSQNQFTFPIIPWFFTNNLTTTVVGVGTFASSSVTVSATNQATQVYNITPVINTTTVSGGVVSGVSGPGPYSVTQVFQITNLAAFTGVIFTTDSSISTPLPATGLMAAVGLPLLGLAGAFRRRVLG